jgi:hypothetical protein
LILKRFVFEKLSSNSFKSQRWPAFMITASGNSHYWRSLMSPACGKDHRWRLSNVTRQWWPTAGGCLMWPSSGDSIYIYTRRALENFLSLARNKRRRQAAKFSHRVPLSSPTAAAPPTTPLSSRSARPTSTSAPPSSARAPPVLPVDRRRLPLGHRPFSRGPPPRRRPRAPCRPTTSFPSATAPLPYQDDVLLPAGRFPNHRLGTAADSTAVASADNSAAPARHRHLISSPLGTHGG